MAAKVLFDTYNTTIKLYKSIIFKSLFSKYILSLIFEKAITNIQVISAMFLKVQYNMLILKFVFIRL